MLRPSETRTGALEFRFCIRDASPHPKRPRHEDESLPGNDTVILLWIGCALLWTTVDEILKSTFKPPPSKGRPAVHRWINTFGHDGGKGLFGPVLILKETDGNDLELVWLFQPWARECRRWARERLVGEIDQEDLGDKLLSRMREEIGKGPRGLARDWATHYDSITPGF